MCLCVPFIQRSLNFFGKRFLFIYLFCVIRTLVLSFPHGLFVSSYLHKLYNCPLPEQKCHSKIVNRSEQRSNNPNLNEHFNSRLDFCRWLYYYFFFFFFTFPCCLLASDHIIISKKKSFWFSRFTHLVHKPEHRPDKLTNLNSNNNNLGMLLHIDKLRHCQLKGKKGVAT